MNLKKLLVVVSLLVASTLPASAQTLLPSAFGGWAASATPSQFGANQAEQVAGDKSAVLREYGLSSVERAEYAQGDGSASIVLYRMVDPSAAYGAFTFLRDPSMAPLGPAAGVPYAAAAHDRTLFIVGNLVIDISSPKARPADADLKTLAGSLTPRADRRPYPDIADFLPPPGLAQSTERYVLGPRGLADVFPSAGAAPRDWIGFDSNSAEAIVARYRLPSAPGGSAARPEAESKNDGAILLIALYPTQQVASDVYSRIPKWFALNPDAPTPDANGRPVVYGTRTGSLIALLSGADSRAAAANLLGQIHYGSLVTWNEPSTTYSDPSIAHIVVGAIMGSGAIMALAFAAGIGFGGFRVLMKFLLPGRVFDRNNQVEILQLGLTSKPIEAKHFYTLKS